MNFEEIWQENKNFILILVGGLVVFVTAWFLVTGHFEDDIKRDLAAAQSSARKEKANRLPAGQVREVEDKLEALQKTLGDLEKELAFRPQPGFTLQGVGKSPDIHFNDTVQKILVDVVEPAASLDIRIPTDLGLGTVTPRTDAEREWFLNGLDIVDRIAVAAIAAQVESVEPIQIAAFPKPKRDRGEDAPYLRVLPVTFTAKGSPGSIDRLMRGLFVPGARLAVESARINSLEARDRKGGVVEENAVTLEMTVQALIVDPAGVPAKLSVARR